MQLLKKLEKLAKTFLKVSPFIILTSCGLPKVTLHQLDTVHGVANPFEIIEYDEKECKIKTKEHEPFHIMSEKLHGGWCLTKEEFAKVKAHIKSECENKNKNTGN